MKEDGQQALAESQAPMSNGSERVSQISLKVKYHGTAAAPNSQWVSERLDKLWRELADAQHNKANFNADIVADHLHRAEVALGKKDPALAKVCLLTAEYWLAQARYCADHHNLGPWIAIVTELVYIVGGLALMFAFGHLTPSVWFDLPVVGSILRDHLVGQPGVVTGVLQTLFQGTNSQPGPGTLTLANTVYRRAHLYSAVGLCWRGRLVSGLGGALGPEACLRYPLSSLVRRSPLRECSSRRRNRIADLGRAVRRRPDRPRQLSGNHDPNRRAVRDQLLVGVSTHYIWRRLDSTLRKAFGEDSTKQNKSNDDDEDNDATVE